MYNKIYKMNAAEGIFFPAFDKYICDDSQISIDEGKVIRNWDSLVFEGGHHFIVHWAGKTILKKYDSFECFFGIPKESNIVISCVIDNQKALLISGEKGQDAPIELRAQLPVHDENAILTDIYIEIDSSLPTNALVLSWFGLVESDMELLVEKNLPVWQEAWEEEIRKDSAGTLRRNLVLSSQEAEQLKRMVAENPKLKNYFSSKAEEGMKIDCHTIMREYAPTGDYRFVRVKDRGRAVLEGPIQNLAIAGWLLDEPRYSVQAARLIVALISMKWCEGPICDLEGSKFHHVCFREDHLLTEVVLAMGFLGGVFSAKMEAKIADKIESAWKVVCEKNREPGYRNFMNQGIVGCRGAMLGALYLHNERGEYAEDIEKIYAKHSQLVKVYLTEEGHCAEGGGYFEYSFTSSILLWHTYAKYSGKSLKEVVPEVFYSAGRYQEAIMSVNSRIGSRIPINCSASDKVNTLLIVFLTLVSNFPEGNNYLIARFEGEEFSENENSFEQLFYLYYKDQISPHPYYRPVKEEISLPKSGLLSYRNGSTKLLVAAERNPYTGHFHEDRGLVVLEAEGEILLPDIGTTTYGNPASQVMPKQAYHNIACPVDLLMQAESDVGMKAAASAAYPITENLTLEDMSMPEAKVLKHIVTEQGYQFAVETGMLFGKGISGIREGELFENRLCLTDTWKFPDQHALMITFLSYEKWNVEKDKNRAFSGRKTLTVSSQQPIHFEEEGCIDYNQRPIYVLRVITEKACEQCVQTTLSWSSDELSTTNSGWKNRLVLQNLLDKGGTVRIEKPGTYEIEDTLYIGSNTNLVLGKGVAFKRSKSSIGSFFLINRGAFTGEWDENISVEGLHLITNAVEARYNSAVYGLTGEVCFFRIKHLRIFDFTCLDLPKLSFGIHICTFENIVLEQLLIEGRKDAVHLGTGKRFVIRHGVFRTFDDPIALNAHDYAVANPQMGWIEDGLIEDCYDLADNDTTGYFCRILAGSWPDWYEGMEIQNSDTVVYNNRVYRAFQKPDGTMYTSVTPPTHTAGMCTLDGIHWVMVQENAIYDCGCRNLHFKDIHLQKKRETALSIHFDHDVFSRSVYPGTKMPVQENITFENIFIQNEVKCLLQSITPINVVKILNSVIGTHENGNSGIELKTLPGEEGKYVKTEVVLIGNTCYGEPEDIVSCQQGREYGLTVFANLNLSKTES